MSCHEVCLGVNGYRILKGSKEQLFSSLQDKPCRQYGYYMLSPSIPEVLQHG